MRELFTVDSGTVLLIDPAYLERFMEYFDEAAFGKSGSPKGYIKSILNRAFPNSKVNNVALLEGFGGDGVFGVTIDEKGRGTIRRSPKGTKIQVGRKGGIATEVDAILPFVEGGLE